MAKSPDEDTEPLVQQLFIGPYIERCMGSQDLASGGLCVLNFMNHNQKEQLNKWIGFILLGLVWAMFLYNNSQPSSLEEPECIPDYMGGCN